MESKNREAKCIAVMGTGSDVGKSIIVTAICRYLKNKGFRVAPYKSQNMSNNSGVTPDGLEMGRAQIVQSEACKLPPHVDMNPILLKPTGETGSQVVLLGEVYENNTALEYHQKKEQLFKKAVACLDRLRAENDYVIIEGAGSCAEVNLMEHDIVNLRIAEYCDAPVILVGDIHRGGIFAQIAGTLMCLSDKQKNLIKGFIINRFRGDIALFKDGISWIEEKTRKKVFGVLPWFNHITIEAEDSVVIEKPVGIKRDNDKPVIAVIRTPHISNFTDFHPLEEIEDINFCFIEKTTDISSFKAIILPGSKNTRGDLRWLEKTGWREKIQDFGSNGGHILGICGGYQIMGEVVRDPDGLEEKPGDSKGLSLLPIETTLKAPKTTTVTEFSWENAKGSGYEIHMGHTKVKGGSSLFKIEKRNNSKPAISSVDGCITEDKKKIGTYIHGLFDSPEITKLWFKTLGLENIKISDLSGLAARDREYDKLSEYFQEFVDIESILG